MLKSLRFFPGGQNRGPALVLLALLCAVMAGSLFLIRREDRFLPPQQEYEYDQVKNSRLVFSRPSGFYEEPFSLQIQAPTREIWYTLDGSDPVRGEEGTLRYEGALEITDATPRDNVYAARTDVTTAFDTEKVEAYGNGERPMNYQLPEDPVDKCTVVRAVYYDAEGKRSGIETASYFVGYGDREGYGSVRVISIVTDPSSLFDYETGIYVTGKTFDDFAAADSFHDKNIWYRNVWWWWDANYNRKGRDWERPANVQFFSETGDLVLQQDAGIRIQGGGSRGFLPKSLNLYARKDYGGNTSFHYDLFGTGYEAKRLTITTGGDDCYTKLKDRLVADLMADQDFSTMHYVPCVLFLDGEYWGFYHLTEKYDEKYFSYYYDVPEEDVIEIKNNQIEVGTEDDLALYQEMKSFIEDSDMSLEDKYDRACALIDMDSFINYYAALIYCGRCGDWPGGNFALWRTRTAPDKEEDRTSAFQDGRWRWILFDVNSAAISSDLQDHDTLRYVLKNKSMKMFASLWANPDFRDRFARRIREYGQTLFSPDNVNALLDRYEAGMTVPMEKHLDRFFGPDAGLDFTQITQTELRDFFAVRSEVVDRFLEEDFSSY